MKMEAAMTHSDGPLGWDDLPALEASAVALRNADLALLGRRVFALGGVPVRFRHEALAPAQASGSAHSTSWASEPAVWLWLEWSGAPLLAGVSAAWAGAVTQTLAGLALDQLGEPGLDLLCQLQLAPLLPAGLILRQAALNREALHNRPSGLQCLGAWVGQHQVTHEPSAHVAQLWAGPGFPLQAFLQSFKPLAREQLPSPLAALPIALPLVAARWRVGADELQDLAVGDVLILG